MAGVLIALEGTDGSGKATQTRLLLERLQEQSRPATSVSFPRYGEPNAYLVEKYLRGEYSQRPDAYQASLLFALDRFDASAQIRHDLAHGLVVAADRYTTSSLAHFGGTLQNTAERHHFYEYLTDLEYNRLKIPRPDKVLVLHMPAALAQRHIEAKKPQFDLGEVSRDIHEDDLSHLVAAERAYLELVQRNAGSYTRIACHSGGRVKPISEIHELIWAEVEPLL